MHPFGITADVLAATRDVHGDETLTTVGHLYGCAFAPSASTEDTDNRALVSITGDLYCIGSSVAVTAQHRVKFAGGLVWAVDGSPEQWDRPYSGGTAGLVIHLKRVTG